MNFDDALPIFITECRELLAEMEQSLLGLMQVEDRADSVNAIFRAAHTIKGSAGLFGLDAIVAFTHVVESVLDRVRENTLELDESLVALLLDCGDHVARLVESVAAGRLQPDEDEGARSVQLIARLNQRLGVEAAPPPRLPATAPRTALATEADARQSDHWHLSLRFGPDVLRSGMDPLSFLRYLNKLGTIVHVELLSEGLPSLQEMDPETCYLGCEIALRSQADKEQIAGTFEFVADDCKVRIMPPDSRTADYIELIRQSGEEPGRLGEILVRCGTLTAHELEQALAQQQRQQEQADAPQRLGEILVEQQRVQPAVVDAALSVQKQARENRDGRAPESQSVRVDADKLDRLIDLVGELITASASAHLAARRARNVELQEAHSQLCALVEEVRDSALQLRMVKIGGTFSRFRRVVHDVSRELGKPIELVIRGEDTELDKTVVEKIGDPLTHLVRNAMDHGIEPAELRAARGKPTHGAVTLNAFHDSGSIVIEVGDDGGGLDKDRILAKAIERGLVEAGRQFSDSEIYGLIFEPGFSTAEQVTNLSGRGVGMDVVKRNITALRGHVQMASEPGAGTTVTVRLPLTLAIINGFQVSVGSSVFVVPLDVVEECVAFIAAPDAEYVDLRGQVLPFIRLREHFAAGGPAAARENLVVVRHAGQKFGLVVDNLLGEAQTVIKPLSRIFANVRGISGSSIQGNGDVALILDVPALIQQATQLRHADAAG